MANYSDLDTLFKNGMGSFAAVQAGRQTADDAQKRALEAMELQQKIRHADQMNPLDLMFRQAELEKTRADAANTQAIGQNNQTTADINKSTQAQQIAAKLSGLSVQIGEDGMKQMAMDGQRALQAAQLLDQVPAMSRAPAFEKIAAQYGFSANNPLLAPIVQGDPNNMPQALKSLGEGMALASSDYIKNNALAKDRREFEAGEGEKDRSNRKEIAGGNNAATLEAARIGANSRIEVAKASAEARKAAQKFMSSDQKITYLSSIPASERTEDENQQLAQLSQQRLAERAAGVNPLAAQLTGTPTAVQSAPGASPFAGTGAPQTGPADAKMKVAVEARGVTYDPNYDYQITPDGRVLRKPKGK